MCRILPQSAANVRVYGWRVVSRLSTDALAYASIVCSRPCPVLLCMSGMNAAQPRRTFDRWYTLSSAVRSTFGGCVVGWCDCTSRVGLSPVAGTRHNAGKARPKWATARRFLQRSCKFIGQFRPPLAPLPPTIQQIPEAAGFPCRAQTFWFFFLSPTLQPRQAHRQALGTAGTREPMGFEENRSQHAIAYHKHKHALPYFQVPTHHMAHTHDMVNVDIGIPNLLMPSTISQFILARDKCRSGTSQVEHWSKQDQQLEMPVG